MTRNKNTTRIELIKWVIPTILMLGFLIMTLISYYKTMEQKAEESVLDSISSQGVMVAGYYNGFYEAMTETLEAFADDSIDHKDNLFDVRQVEMLDRLVDKLSLKKGYIVKKDLTTIDNKGKYYDSFSDNEELIELIDSKKSSESVVDEDGDTVMYVSAPIRTESEWYGNVVFVFHPNKMHYFINDKSAFSYMFVFSTGMVAETMGRNHDLFKEGDNMNDILSTLEFVEGSQEMVQKAAEAHKSGRFVVKDLSGARHYVSFQPVGDYRAYTMVCALEDQISESIKYENRNTRNLVNKVIILMVGFAGLILVIYLITKINISRINKDLKNKAETDLLTGLNNKISTELKIKEYLEGEGKDKMNMFCILDVDNFKKINDTMGHAFGDEVLANIGRGLTTEFRVTDIVGRTGGDEFIIFLKDLKSQEVVEREAKRIESYFRALQVGAYTKYSPTASIGIAVTPNDGSDYISLYKAADSALYKAKERGKNQVAFYREDNNKQ